jgi:hypothetical protein
MASAGVSERRPGRRHRWPAPIAPRTARRPSRWLPPNDFAAATLPTDALHRDVAAPAGGQAAPHTISQRPRPGSVGPIAATVNRLAVRAVRAMSAGADRNELTANP